MSNLKTNIFSPILKSDKSVFFNIGGCNFEMTDSHIHEIKNVNDGFKSLVDAMSTFKLDESGIIAYYDLKNNCFVKETDDNSISNSSNYFRLTEMKSFLIDKKKQLKLNNMSHAVEDIELEMLDVDSKINESVKKPMVTRFKYDANSGKTYINNIEILDEGTANHIFATGHVLYEHKPYLDLFEFASKNFSLYQNIDFASAVIEEDVITTTMRSGDLAFIHRNNRATKLTKMQVLKPADAIEHMLENTGIDISFMFTDILENSKIDKIERESKINQMYEMISFLKDQRDVLASANKNIQEIKEADLLINSEISRIENEIKVLEQGPDRNDGYVPGTINTEYNGLPEGTQLSIDAMAYTNAGPDDLVNVYAGEEILKIEKRYINLNSSETI